MINRFRIVLPLILGFLIPFSAMSQDKPAYRLLNAKGKEVSYRKAMKQLKDADVVFFGELHNNPIAHWLQWEVMNDLTEERKKMAIGFEMFETDQQQALDSLAAGQYSLETFGEATRLWPNFETDYWPLVQLAMANDIPMWATNVPRQYARQVSRQGLASLDSLPANEKALLAPLPIVVDETIPSYAEMREMLAGHGGGMNPSDFVAAQALKDATMADGILRHLDKGMLFYHVNGSYHSDYKEGIIWHLLRARPELQVMNLTVIESDTMEWEPEGDRVPADFIILVPASMTKTY